MQHDDLPGVLACENRFSKPGPDFETPVLPGYAWRSQDIITAVKQYKTKEPVQHDTRALVAIAEHPRSKKLWVAGAFIYELCEFGYNLVLFTTHAKAPIETCNEMLDYVLGKASRSDKRKLVSVIVNDNDYDTLKFFTGRGFGTKLQSNFFKDGTDAWLCSFRVATPKVMVSSI
jgi:hypothetical protein